MSLTFELAGSQIDGARDYQEDAFLITNLTDSDGNPAALVVVADGMGGHAAGNVASNMAVQAFNKHVSANYPTDKVSEILNEAVLKANNSISETIKETPALQGMGCTMVAAILEKGKIWWASVGDSHLYRIRDRELEKVNADHSYGGFLDRMEAAGTPVEPEAGLSRNMLMSAITGEEINEIDCPSEPLELDPGDKILICSDGLDTLSSGKIIQFSDWSESPKECADALLNAVEEAGMPRQDNTTVVVVNVREGAAAAETAAPAADASGAEEIEVTAEHTIGGDEAGAAEPPPQPGPSAQVYESETPSGKSPVGIIAAVVVVLLAVGGGAFFMLSGDKPAPEVAVTEPEMASPEPEADAEVPEEAEIDEDEAEPEVATSPEPEAAPAETTEEAKVPAAAAAPEPEKPAPTDKEFQDDLKSGGKGPVMVRVPAGSFQMGSSGSSRFAEERPRHKVTLEAFAISKYEVTFAEYEQFAKAEGRKIPDNLYLDKATHPVIYVSWDDAYYYTKWLSEQTGQKYSLPSEAQWEYAASTGKKSPFWWGYEEEPGRAHCFGCGSGFDPRKPTKIGSFSPNAFGLHDTAGNVAEWVQDCWHEDYKGAPEDGSVWEGGDCSYRIVRGGSYSSPPNSLRSQKRDKYKSEKVYDHIGFRVVRKLD
ncbi:MAG: SUMF1/EgtB/PvdO family nonheme iron enzyme [Gammaproteobacteria bacterium]|nr:SUMF1/EgtB/PvdO family nonheme iron enzyme [Gammaproteobacteria bacterium]